jgi:hypothetical protein
MEACNVSASVICYGRMILRDTIKRLDLDSKLLKLREWKNRPKKDGDFFITYVISVPPDLVKELGWRKNQQLKAKSDGHRLIIERE